VNYANSLVVTITVTCNLWTPSSGDHLFTCGAIYLPPHTQSQFAIESVFPHNFFAIYQALGEYAQNVWKLTKSFCLSVVVRNLFKSVYLSTKFFVFLLRPILFS